MGIPGIHDRDGLGYVIISIENGVVYGDTKIHPTKVKKVKDLEDVLADIPEEIDSENAFLYKEIIYSAKIIYDEMSEKEQGQLSDSPKNKMFAYINFFSNYTMTVSAGIIVENEESMISADEMEEDIEFILTVSETTVEDAGEIGITTAKEYETEKIKDKKGKNKEIAKYYDITLSKNGQNISNIQKQTETNGKLLITMPIPEEYRGHKQYSFIHMHKGEAITLADMDDNPDTVTFEIDKFSTFALAYSDVGLTEITYPASIVYDTNTGMISVSSTEDGTLYIATYENGCISNVKQFSVIANSNAEVYAITANQTAFIWNSDLEPLCEKFSIEN